MNPTDSRQQSYESVRARVGTFIMVCVVLVAIYAAATIIMNDELVGFAYAGIVAFAAIALVAILNDWRRGLYFFLVWIMFEDFARKYLGNNMAIYFGKDLLALVIYFAFFWSRRATLVPVFKPPFAMPLLFFFGLGLIQVFNPLSTSIFYGLMGMKIYFFYVPMIFIGYSLIDSEQALHRFLSFNSVLILVVVTLGIVQSVLGHTFLNPAVIQEDIRNLSTNYRVSPLTGLIAYRPTSVFVSTGRFSNFLMISWPIALGFGGYLLMRKREGRILAFATVAIVAAGSIMAASRGVIMWNITSAIVIVAGFIWGTPWKNRMGVRVIRAIHRSVLFVVLGFIILLASFPEAVGSRLAIYSETLSPSSEKSELLFRSRDYPFQNFIKAFNFPHWPYGYGIGTASLGVQYVSHIMHAAPMNIGVENGYGQLILELGLLGLVLWIVLSVSIAVHAWKAVRRLKDTPWFPIGFAIFWFAFLLVVPMSYFGLVSYQDFLVNSYFWLLLGILFRITTFPRKLMAVTQVQPA